ncbi:hypothetical protein BH23ACT9_BH23ACT9_06700 [soil metagenome]
MPNDVSKDRLDRLREDLASLRARATAEFDLPPPSETRHEPVEDRAEDGSADATAVAETVGTDVQVIEYPVMVGGTVREPTPAEAADEADAEAADEADPAATAIKPEPVPAAGERPRTPDRDKRSTSRRTTSRPPRPPRRGPFRPRVRRPPRRVAVAHPIPVARRPSYLAGPRWPQWTLVSGLLVALVILPATLQLAYRLVQAMLDTTVLLGATPTRVDFLHAAGGVAGGGLTLAAALAAVGIAKGKGGYLAGAGGVIGGFCVLPVLIYTANAGIVSAPLPQIAEMIRPPAWENTAVLGAVYWLSVIALVTAAADLLYRSTRAIWRTLAPQG